MSLPTETTASPRERILVAAADLLARGGRDAVSTRAVAAAAGVQAPTIYRQFGDMQGLMREVASRGFAEYLRAKITRGHAEDPVDDLRLGWDLHVEFGLTHPDHYTLMYGNPQPGPLPAAAVQAAGVLRRLVERVAEAGRLRVSVERAAQMIHSTGVGVVLTLLASPADDRDTSLSTATCEAVLAAVTSGQTGAQQSEETGPARVSTRAVGLKAVLSDVADRFTLGELTLLSEWLDRMQ